MIKIMIILKILVSISIYNPYRNLEIRNYKSWLEWLQGTILAGTRQPSSHRHEGSAVAMAASALPIRGGSLSSPIPNISKPGQCPINAVGVCWGGFFFETLLSHPNAITKGRGATGSTSGFHAFPCRSPRDQSPGTKADDSKNSKTQNQGPQGKDMEKP